ncbi:MAG TPA: globin family protein [Burkholderiales bacterium]|nr:globin family protein [Burkholderiales bacterium]
MTPKQIQLVQASWRQVLPIADAAAELFYSRLFELDPTLRKLFRGELQEQGGKLMEMIDLAVQSLARTDALRLGLRALGRRHAGYGVRDEHYDTVSRALLWALGKGLGAAFTPEVEQAWAAAYGFLAATMKDAANLPA